MEQAVASIGHGVFCYNTEEEQEQMKLPPGFRFHPTDEELITHYLSKKVADNSFDPRAIGEIDLNKNEPWELPRRAKLGEKEWYFFCLRDRKYLTGLRTNRATGAGYWKATGKDKEVYRERQLVGMKKTLVFYIGRAPRGEKSNWVMHEYRLEEKQPLYSLPRAIKSEWVICRIIKKSLVGNGKNVITLKTCSSPHGEEAEVVHQPPTPPSLLDGQAHVTCFSSDDHEHLPASASTSRCSNPSFQPAPSIYSYADIFSAFSKSTPSPGSSYGVGVMNAAEGDHSTKQRRKMEREMFGVPQETGRTANNYAEISSWIEIERSVFEECLWNCWSR